MAIDLERFRTMYFDEARANARCLHQALNAGDEAARVAAVRAAHSIKGSSGAFGFDELIALCQALEDLFSSVAPGPSAEAEDALRLLDELIDCRERREDPDLLAVGRCCQRLLERVRSVDAKN
jgi:two-component system, chemotaxis family, sensor kinase CheA